MAMATTTERTDGAWLDYTELTVPYGPDLFGPECPDKHPTRSEPLITRPADPRRGLFGR